MVFQRDESKVRKVPDIVILFSGLQWIAVGVLSVCALITGGIGWLIAIAAILLVGVFEDKFFDWHNNVKYDFSDNGKLVYTYDLSAGVLPSKNRTVKVKVSDVKKVNIRGTKAKVYGDIKYRRPFKNEESKKYITLNVRGFEDGLIERLVGMAD